MHARRSHMAYIDPKIRTGRGRSLTLERQLLGTLGGDLGTKSIQQHWELAQRVRKARYCCRQPPMACLTYRYVLRLGIANGVARWRVLSAFLTRDSATGLSVHAPRHALYVGSGVRLCVAAYDDLCMRPSSVSLSGREIIASIIKPSTRRDCHNVESSRVCVIESVAAGACCYVAFCLESDTG